MNGTNTSGTVFRHYLDIITVFIKILNFYFNIFNFYLFLLVFFLFFLLHHVKLGGKKTFLFFIYFR